MCKQWKPSLWLIYAFQRICQPTREQRLDITFTVSGAAMGVWGRWNVLWDFLKGQWKQASIFPWILAYIAFQNLLWLPVLCLHPGRAHCTILACSSGYGPHKISSRGGQNGVSLTYTHAHTYTSIYTYVFIWCFILFLCVHVFPACSMYTTCMPGAYKDQKWMSDALELGIMDSVDYHVSARNQTYKSNKWS